MYSSCSIFSWRLSRIISLLKWISCHQIWETRINAFRWKNTTKWLFVENLLFIDLGPDNIWLIEFCDIVKSSLFLSVPDRPFLVLYWPGIIYNVFQNLTHPHVVFISNSGSRHRFFYFLWRSMFWVNFSFYLIQFLLLLIIGILRQKAREIYCLGGRQSFSWGCFWKWLLFNSMSRIKHTLISICHSIAKRKTLLSVSSLCFKNRTTNIEQSWGWYSTL
jgi:hypothetical protein